MNTVEYWKGCKDPNGKWQKLKPVKLNEGLQGDTGTWGTVPPTLAIARVDLWLHYPGTHSQETTVQLTSNVMVVEKLSRVHRVDDGAS